MSLHPIAERGSLRIHIGSNTVDVHGTHCVHKTGPVGSIKNKDCTEQELQDIHTTLSLNICQITGKFVIAAKE